MKPYFSIVIPYHNAHKSIVPLLQSIAVSVGTTSYEVIVVDDGSPLPFGLKRSKRMKKSGLRRDYIGSVALNIGKNVSLMAPVSATIAFGKACLGVVSISLSVNKGPAVARNVGALVARGEFLIFFDSDVVLFPDTLQNLATMYRDDPDIVAVTGVWTKEQKSRAFFPNFKALRDWSYWINERDKSGYYFLFSTRIASIKKTVFDRLGGFNESYNAALVEDIELTYRIARRYAIIFAPNVRVRHEFESFWPIAKKYFLRAYHWTRLYNERKKFDPVATTIQEALTTISGVFFVLFFVACFISLPSLPLITFASSFAPTSIIWLSMIFYCLAALSGIVHLFLTRTFLSYMAREKGVVFAIKGFVVGLVLYCFIFAGALWGRIKK